MKIQKEFAPITITLETKQDLDDLLNILHTVEWQYRHDRHGDQGGLEKVQLFLKDLK